MNIKDILEWIPLLLVLGGVVIFVRNYRKLARMTPAERARLQPDWHDEMMDPTNLSGWTNPDSGVYIGRRDDD